MTNHRKLYTGEVLSIVALVAILMGYIAFVIAIPTAYVPRRHERQHVEAVMTNDPVERQLAQELSEKLYTATGVEVSEGYLKPNDSNEKAYFSCKVDGNVKTFIIEDLSAANSLRFNSDSWEFTPAA